MRTFSILRLIVSAVSGLLIGLVITALVNLFNPISDIAWVIVAVCVGSLLSAVTGYLIGFGRLKEKESKPPQ
jgi:O-antigen/teichoic acid export membrane protein